MASQTEAMKQKDAFSRVTSYHVTKQNNLYIKLQHSSAASLFRTSLEIGQNLHSTAKLRMMFAQLHQFKKLNSILYIIRNTLLKICILPAPPEVCYATPRGVATPSLGSPDVIDTLKFIGELGIPFRGHRDSGRVEPVTEIKDIDTSTGNFEQYCSFTQWATPTWQGF